VPSQPMRAPSRALCPRRRSHLQAVFLALGLSPGRQELGDVLRQMETLSVIRAGQALLRGAPDDERRAEAFTGVLRQIQGIKEMVVVPDAELHKKLASISLVTDPRPAVTMAELMAQGDQVTVDLMPVGWLGRISAAMLRTSRRGEVDRSRHRPPPGPLPPQDDTCSLRNRRRVRSAGILSSMVQVTPA
jgi:hypothetical protein